MRTLTSKTTHDFPARLEQVSRIRRFARKMTAGHPCADDVTLAVSELAANAIEHSAQQAGSRIAVQVAHLDDVVLIDVRDGGGADMPRLRHASEDATTGRGLVLVDALALTWGSSRDEFGTHVWCTIGCPCHGSSVAGPAAAWRPRALVLPPPAGDAAAASGARCWQLLVGGPGWRRHQDLRARTPPRQSRVGATCG
ncbi:ATP-binding protein [[Actinomadura] parvosata]|uniref:ATP-binding protein n=1 Tax=[Actinomadura] parvosata TaxID=1955412 RepID=UPI00406CC4D5